MVQNATVHVVRGARKFEHITTVLHPAHLWIPFKLMMIV